mmetsp:Transcript_3568/g.14049  ORF Transcript_3568/g.14049 Transcript_3568/m.14049 type:complete len:219 (+) Transcript_3568:1139-1795(+)
MGEVVDVLLLNWEVGSPDVDLVEHAALLHPAQGEHPRAFESIAEDVFLHIAAMMPQHYASRYDALADFSNLRSSRLFRRILHVTEFSQDFLVKVEADLARLLLVLLPRHRFGGPPEMLRHLFHPQGDAVLVTKLAEVPGLQPALFSIAVVDVEGYHSLYPWKLARAIPKERQDARDDHAVDAAAERNECSLGRPLSKKGFHGPDDGVRAHPAVRVQSR